MGLSETKLRARGADVGFYAKTKHYPDGSQCTYYASRPIFREEGGWEAAETYKAPRKALRDAGTAPTATADEAPRSTERARRRARTAVRDYARTNLTLTYFVTLTLDGSKVDRYDPEIAVKKLTTWLDNHVKRSGLQYVVIPEYHQDQAIHFHGLINDVLEMSDSGTIIPPGGGKPRKPRSRKQRDEWLAAGGKVVYNLEQWPWGFTTAIKLYGNRESAIAYVCKYISKSDQKIGGRWYYSGGGLKKPALSYSDVTAQEAREAMPDAYYTEIPEAALCMVIDDRRVSDG